jgi:hypothetical protein
MRREFVANTFVIAAIIALVIGSSGLQALIASCRSGFTPDTVLKNLVALRSDSRLSVGRKADLRQREITPSVLNDGQFLGRKK